MSKTLSDEQREALKISKYLIKKRHFNTAESILSDIKHPVSRKMLAYIEKQRKLEKRYGRDAENAPAIPVKSGRKQRSPQFRELPSFFSVSTIPAIGLVFIGLLMLFGSGDTSGAIRTLILVTLLAWILANVLKRLYGYFSVIHMERTEYANGVQYRNEGLNLTVQWQEEQPG